MNEQYNEIPSLSEDQESEDEDLKMVDMVPSEDQYLTETDDETTDDEDDMDDAVEDETDENDDDDSDNDVPLDEQEQEENTIVDPTTASYHSHHTADSMIEKEHTTTTMPGTLNLHLNLNLNKEGEQSMSQRKAALTVEEVNEQNHVKDTGYNFQSAQDRPATLDQYDLTNDPHRDFDNMQGQTSIYSMRATATTAMRLAARMLKHGLRDGDVNDPTAVADVADEIRDTMSEGEARDKADILKEMDDKNDDEIREIEHEIHDDKDHMKMDDKDIHDDEKHLDRLEKAHHARRRKASWDLDEIDSMDDTWNDFINNAGEWGKFLHHLGLLADDDLGELGVENVNDLQGAITEFLNTSGRDNLIPNLEAIHEKMIDFVFDSYSVASRHSHRSRKASRRKADFDVIPDIDAGTMDEFIENADDLGELLYTISDLSMEELKKLDDNDQMDLQDAINSFTRHVTRRTLDGLDSVENRLAYINGEDRSSDPWSEAFSSHHHKASRYRKASNLETMSSALNHYDEFRNAAYDMGALLDSIAHLTEDQIDDLSDEEAKTALVGILSFFKNFTDSTYSGLLDAQEDLLQNLMDRNIPGFNPSLYTAHRSRRRHAADERTVCDVRMTKDGDYEARCDGKVKRFDKKGDALEWLYDHFTDSYHDKPEFTVQAARALKQIESSRTATPSVRMASSMSPSKTDISSILL